MEQFQFLEDYPALWWIVLAIILVVIFGILFWIFTVDNTIPAEKENASFFRRFFRRSFYRNPNPTNTEEKKDRNTTNTY